MDKSDNRFYRERGLEALAGFGDEYRPRRKCRLLAMLERKPDRVERYPLPSGATLTHVSRSGTFEPQTSIEIKDGLMIKPSPVDRAWAKHYQRAKRDLANERSAANLCLEILAQWYEEYGSKAGALADNTLAVLEAARREGRIE